MIYEPAEDSFLLQEQVRKFSKNKKVLDIGTGSGIQAKTALESGASSVTATDINKQALSKIKVKKINLIHSDLFAKVKHKFDIIIFNPPYLPEDSREDTESSIITSGGVRGDELTVKFLSQAKEHLNKNGIILLVVSSLTPQDQINKILKENRLSKEVLSQKKFFMEIIEVWKITQFKQ